MFFFLAVLLPSTMDVVLSQLAEIKAEIEQQTRLIRSIMAAVQTADDDDDPCELPEGVLLPLETLSQLMDLEKSLHDADNYRKLVSMV